MKLHALLGHPVSENFVSWCQNVEEQLCIVFMYTGTPISSPLIQTCVHLKCFCFVYDVWTTDLRFCQVNLLTQFPWQG
jgi:hypothetical protein